MAITGRTPDDCFAQFLGHVSKLVANMLTQRYPMQCLRPPKGRRDTNKRTLSFVSDDDNAIPLVTREHGTLYLYLAQELWTEELARNSYKLRTIRYWYKLYAQSPSVDDDAIVRWEYAKVAPVHSTSCRHHVQFGKMVTPLPLGGSVFNFEHFHMPTGWVMLEEICRFLICEFGVEPPCGDEWPRVLSEGEDAFYGGFTNRGGSGRS